jgi:hypothetical protein
VLDGFHVALVAIAGELYAARGIARAQALTPTKRSEIAKKAAAARWDGQSLPVATHRGKLNIGGGHIPCAVLENGKRVITENGITIALLGTRSGAEARTPKNEKGVRKNKFHQWLTDDVGHPMLAQHMHSILMFQRLAIANGQGWTRFMRTVDQVMPKRGQNLELPGLDPGPN